VVDSKFTAFFEATTLGNFESKTTRDHYVASVRIEAEVRKADVPNDTNFRFGTLGFHIIEVPPRCESTEFHVHYFEDECTYVLSGSGVVTIGDDEIDIANGDFIGYRAGGLAHTMKNNADVPLVCIVVGQRLAHDVGDYPNKQKRIYRNEGLPWDLVDLGELTHPQAGKK